MDNDVLFGLGVLLLCWSTGCSQTSSNRILSKSVVEREGSFTVTCDASRAAVPDDALILKLLIKLKIGADETALAYYWTYTPPYTYHDKTRRPPWRDWTYNFTGSLRGTSDVPKNRNTMKIEIKVSDAKCQDAGSYFCCVEYYVSNPEDTDAESYQTLTVAGCKWRL